MVKMSDIALRVGVSQTTVSYVLNRRGADMRINAETQQRILDVASEMGYRRNEVARTMVTGRTRNFAFMTQGPNDELAIRIMVGAQEQADEHDYVIQLFPVTPKMNFQKRIERCMEQRIAGVLVVNITPEAMQHLDLETKRFGVPAVLLDDAPTTHSAIRIVADNDLGVRQAIQHLAGLGHRRIGFISGHEGSPPGEARGQSFLQVMQEMNLSLHPRSIIHTNWHQQDVIAQGVRQFMSVAPEVRPTALLCAGDKIAFVAMRTLRALGYSVPHDVSVMGFADFRMGAYSDPPLTTVAQPFEDMGRVAVRHLMERITTPKNVEPIDIALPTRLVVRESTAAPRV